MANGEPILDELALMMQDGENLPQKQVLRLILAQLRANSAVVNKLFQEVMALKEEMRDDREALKQLTTRLPCPDCPKMDMKGNPLIALGVWMKKPKVILSMILLVIVLVLCLDPTTREVGLKALGAIFR
jgi:hypothetical protein